MGEGLVTSSFLSSQTKLSPKVAIMSRKAERGEIFSLRRKKKENSWDQDPFTGNTNLISKGGERGCYSESLFDKKNSKPVLVDHSFSFQVVNYVLMFPLLFL